MLAVLGPLQLELRPPRDHLVAVVDEVLQDLPEIHLLRDAVRQREHDRAEGRLHLRVLVELIEHHRGHGVALQLDDDPDSLLIGFVAQVRDALELLREHEVARLLDDALRRHLVGELRHDDLVAARGLFFFDHRPRAHGDAAAPLLVDLLDPLLPVDDPARGEIRPFDELPEVLDGRVGVIDEMGDRLDHLGEVVRRNVGRHPHGDPRRAVDDEVGEPRGQHQRLLQAAVEVGDEVNGILLDVLQHRHGDARQSGLGVAIGGGRVAVDRAEVPLAVDQRVAQREILRHADQRVVERDVAVWVVLAEHVADDGGALLERAAGVQPQLVHRVEDAAVHRLQAVAHLGQRARDDHAHRVVEERLLELVLDEPGEDTLADVGSGHSLSVSRSVGRSDGNALSVGKVNT